MLINRNEDARYIAEKIRSKQVSAEEAVKDAIERIESLNPDLNAVVHQRFDQALQEARTRNF